MLVTTLGRIDRLNDAIRLYSEPDDYYTPEYRAKKVDECYESLAKEHEKLRHYNKLASQLLRG